jgi:hypothetical protein
MHSGTVRREGDKFSLGPVGVAALTLGRCHSPEVSKSLFTISEWPASGSVCRQVREEGGSVYRYTTE